MGFKPFQIGKYTFEEPLGRGGMAEVYRATARGAGSFLKQFAVKRIIPGALDNDAVKRFKEEAHLNSKMSHPNIVQVFDFVEDDGNFLLVMEFVHGPDLSAVLKRCRKKRQAVSSEFAAYVTQAICQGLDYAYHSIPPGAAEPLRIVHRDISPQNIMLTYEGHVKLVDFGIAKAASHLKLTRPGFVRGKVPYFSPEQANAQTVDHRSDIFSAGLVLLEMLIGAKAYGGESDNEILTNARERNLPALIESNPLIPKGLFPILTRALERDPDHRYQSAGEMGRELRRFLDEVSPSYDEHRVSKKLGVLFDQEKRQAQAPSRRSTPLSTREEMELLAGLEGFGRQLGGVAEAKVEAEAGIESEFSAEALRSNEIQLQTHVNVRVPRGSRRRKSVLRWFKVAGFVMVVSAVFLFRARLHRSPATATGSPGCQLSIESLPPKAHAVVNDRPAGEAPVTVNVPCGESVRLVLQRSGYKTYSGRVTIEEAAGSVRVKLEKKGRP